MSLIEDYGYIEFKSVKEGWSEYLLEDKTLIRLRAVPLKILKRDEGLRVNIQKLIMAFSPVKGVPDAGDHIPAKLLSSIKRSDIPFNSIKDDWDEYELSDGTKISLKEVLSLASSTDKFDSIGDPIYVIQSQTLYKGLPKR